MTKRGNSLLRNRVIAARAVFAGSQTGFGAGRRYRRVRYEVMTQRGNSLLRNRVIAARAVLAGSQTGFGAGRRYRSVGHDVVTQRGNSLLRNEDLVADRAVAAFGQAGFGAGRRNRSVRGNRVSGRRDNPTVCGDLGIPFCIAEVLVARTTPVGAVACLCAGCGHCLMILQAMHMIGYGSKDRGVGFIAGHCGQRVDGCLAVRAPARKGVSVLRRRRLCRRFTRISRRLAVGYLLRLQRGAVAVHPCNRVKVRNRVLRIMRRVRDRMVADGAIITAHRTAEPTAGDGDRAALY